MKPSQRVTERSERRVRASGEHPRVREGARPSRRQEDRREGTLGSVPGASVSERRRYPRVDETLRLQVHRGPEELVAETVNVSCGGALCRLDRPLRPMTKVAVALALPTRLVRCTAAVVRCRVVRRAEARARGRYQLALFFTGVSRQDHRAIAEFILESMLTHTHGPRRS